MKHLILFIFITAFSLSCNKSSDFKNEKEHSGEIASIKPIYGPNQLDDARKFTEFACVTGNCAGTVCEGSQGTCKARACTAIPGGCVEQRTSEQIEAFAIEHANRMVDEGYISKEDFKRSKELAKQILKNAQ